MRRWLVPLLAERRYRFAEDRTTIFNPLAAVRPSLVLNYATRTRAPSIDARLLPRRFLRPPYLPRTSP